jgi:hypothetical protein
MVLAAKQRSLYELTDAISALGSGARAGAAARAAEQLGRGEDSAIGHLYMLARTFRQMLVILEKNVRDSRAIWQALWQGFRMPPFAADDVIRQARRYKSAPRADAGAAADCARGLELRSSAAGQAAGAGAAGATSWLRNRSRCRGCSRRRSFRSRGSRAKNERAARPRRKGRGVRRATLLRARNRGPAQC